MLCGKRGGGNCLEKSNIKIRYILVFLLIQLLDLLTTIVGIKYFGMIEVNPIMKQFSLWQMSLLKMAGILIIITILYFLKKIPEWGYWILIGVSSIPVPLNMFQIASEVLKILSN